MIYCWCTNCWGDTKTSPEVSRIMAHDINFAMVVIKTIWVLWLLIILLSLLTVHNSVVLVHLRARHRSHRSNLCDFQVATYVFLCPTWDCFLSLASIPNILPRQGPDPLCPWQPSFNKADVDLSFVWQSCYGCSSQHNFIWVQFWIVFQAIHQHCPHFAECRTL